ncbi:hypothetical protein BOTBODRAFT_145232 [Botryobasidium botryosum FD-172 SS1]|uniref:Uncharacterized protein n=1 Tax=Botryobasidium botryosum (strain FD-172 SS1) TaxID=930990 RepID=A0A067MI08_BOTB1|nr:hypothetical protein BOTBODRAFT_145232 [Botryobasidium botryosum FD-172 SS1]
MSHANNTRPASKDEKDSTGELHAAGRQRDKPPHTTSGNSYNWSRLRKWVLTIQAKFLILLATGAFGVSFGSSAYVGGLDTMKRNLHMCAVVATLGLSLAPIIRPAFGDIWQGMHSLVVYRYFLPTQELRFQRIVFLGTYTLFMLFQLGRSLTQNTATLLTTRFLAGAFGPPPFTNAAGTIANIWVAAERSTPQTLYAMGTIRVAELMDKPMNFYTEFLVGRPLYLKFDKDKDIRLSTVMKVILSRPFVFLSTGLIVALLSLYMVVAYAILYALVAVFPTVFEQQRHFNTGEGGLAFLGVGSHLGYIGVHRPGARTVRLLQELDCQLGCSGLHVHWISPILAGISFGMGMLFILASTLGHLMET